MQQLSLTVGSHPAGQHAGVLPLGPSWPTRCSGQSLPLAQPYLHALYLGAACSQARIPKWRAHIARACLNLATPDNLHTHTHRLPQGQSTGRPSSRRGTRCNGGKDVPQLLDDGPAQPAVGSRQRCSLLRAAPACGSRRRRAAVRLSLYSGGERWLACIMGERAPCWGQDCAKCWHSCATDLLTMQRSA